MPLRPAPVVFTVGPEVDPDRLRRWLPGLRPAGPVRTTDRTLLDTFDGRLRRRDLTLWRSATGAKNTLHLEGFAAPLALSAAAATKAALSGADLPDGAAAREIRTVIGERALLAQVRVRCRQVPLRLCDGEDKTVVRLVLEEPVVVARPRRPAALDRRLHVEAVLGYPRDRERVLAALRRRLAPAERPVADEAVVAAGRPLRGVTSDVEVRLDGAMPAEQATSLICRRLADVVDANLAGVLDDTDPEFLHDLRVAVRRTRSVLKEMTAVLLPAPLATARADLRWIQEITGPTRDLDVLLLSWPEMASPVPVGMRADLEPLVELLHQRRLAAWSAMRAQLRSRRFAQAWARWRATLEEGGFAGPAAGRPIGDLAGRRIVSVYDAMLRMGSAIDDGSPPEALHDLRKRGKELRYLLELFGSVWAPGQVKPLVSALKALQDELGHFQDDEIQARELRGLGPPLAATPGGTDSLIALGFVLEGLSVRQRQARDDFTRRFADFASPATRQAVAAFRRPK